MRRCGDEADPPTSPEGDVPEASTGAGSEELEDVGEVELGGSLVVDPALEPEEALVVASSVELGAGEAESADEVGSVDVEPLGVVDAVVDVGPVDVDVELGGGVCVVVVGGGLVAPDAVPVVPDVAPVAVVVTPEVVEVVAPAGVVEVVAPARVLVAV